MTHTVWQWMFLFFVYCIAGWCIESTIVSLQMKKPVNRGFLQGPWLPLYGTGAMLILFVTLPVRGRPALVFLVGMVAATLLEYITGVVMEALFKVKYWDYSGHHMQFQGRICLESSLFWGFLSLVLTDLIHPPLEKLASWFHPAALMAIVLAACALFLCDLATSVYTAANLASTLEKMTKIKAELDALKEKLATAAQQDKEKLRSRLAAIASERRQLVDRLGYLKTHLLKNNPGATSAKFKEALQELKGRMK